MNKLLAATAAALIPLAGLAAEADRNPDPSAPTGQVASFDALDTNKDGRISMPEASVDPKLVENFSRVDKDGDGYLDSSEYANSRDKAPQQ